MSVATRIHTGDKSLAIERVRFALDYDPATGVFRWLESFSNAAPAGTVAGSVNKRGYVLVQIGGRKYPAHRLAWFYMYGGWPDGQIDHINGNTSDNRIANLRPATCAQNQANAARRKDNKSGYKGVSFHSGTRWSATIQHQGKRIHLGLFATPESAAESYRTAAIALKGEFARAA